MISTFVSSVNSYLIITLHINKLNRLNAELFDILVIAIHLGIINLELLCVLGHTLHINHNIILRDLAQKLGGNPEQSGL